MADADIDPALLALKRLEKSHGSCKFDLDFPTVMAVVSMLQLALRHPGAKNSPTARQVRRFLDELILPIAHAEPELGALLLKGFDPRFDVPGQNGGGKPS